MNSENTSTGSPRLGFAGRMAAMFIDSKLTPIAIIASILLGIMSRPGEQEDTQRPQRRSTTTLFAQSVAR